MAWTALKIMWLLLARLAQMASWMAWTALIILWCCVGPQREWLVASAGEFVWRVHAITNNTDFTRPQFVASAYVFFRKQLCLQTTQYEIYIVCWLCRPALRSAIFAADRLRANLRG